MCAGLPPAKISPSAQPPQPAGHASASVSVRDFLQDDIIREQLTRNIQFFGEEGQQRIADAFVIVVGLGVGGQRTHTQRQPHSLHLHTDHSHTNARTSHHGNGAWQRHKHTAEDFRALQQTMRADVAMARVPACRSDVTRLTTACMCACVCVTLLPAGRGLPRCPHAPACWCGSHASH